MAVTYDNTVKTARMTATRDSVADGSLVIMTSADVVLATFALSTAGGTISEATWTLTFDASTVIAGASGTASKAEIRNSSGTPRITGLTVGVADSDINLTSVSVTAGQSVLLTEATITHAI